jgi:hypothetical protein
VAVFTEAEAVVAASMGMEARIAVAVGKLVKVAGDPMKAAGDLMAEEATVEVEHRLAAMQDHLGSARLAAVHSIVVLTIFTPPSTMANGIRLAALGVPRDLRAQARGAIPEELSTPRSWPATQVSPMVPGILLADPAGAHEARPVSQEDLAQVSIPDSAIETALATEAVLGAGVVAALVSASAGVVGDSASDGRSGDGDRTTHGATHTATTHTGILRGLPITTIRTTATTGPTIRRLIGRQMTTTSRQATRHQAQRTSRLPRHRSRSWKKCSNS